MKDAEFSVLLGKTLSAIRQSEDELIFETTTGEVFRQYHHQHCCETVEIESITGDLDDLIGTPILVAEVSSSRSDIDFESATWTFYKLATVQGWVDIRWLGTSNGYYSESVDFEQVAP